MKNTALVILGLALVTAAAPVGKAATACDIQYTHVNNAWRAASNECCADTNDDGRCNGGWLKPTPNKTMGYKNMADSAQPCYDPGSGYVGVYQQTGLGGDSWYRFEGAGGDALPLQPPKAGSSRDEQCGPEKCACARGCPECPDTWPPHDRLHGGTSNGGWLSGWKWPATQNCMTKNGNPEDAYCPLDINGNNLECLSSGIHRGMCTPGDTISGGPGWNITRTPFGRYPTAAEGVVNMTVCFDSEDNGSCDSYAEVGVLRCEGFMLWRLPYAPGCKAAYCTVNANVGMSAKHQSEMII